MLFSVDKRVNRKGIKDLGNSQLMNNRCMGKGVIGDKKTCSPDSLRYPRIPLRLSRGLSTGRRYHFATGIVNSAPFAIEAGQRCITDL
jgi:hypothetical protein